MKKRERRKELLKIVKKSGENAAVLTPLVDDVVFIEARLAELKQLPFIRIDQENPQRQQVTPAAKQYKELLQQYTNLIKVLMIGTGDAGDVETSPLRLWAQKNLETRGSL